ncbi:MAG: hypothetical protein AB1512_12795 [Thermodesulfobacteriota bacterium]
MTKTQVAWTLLLALAAGLGGGVLAFRLLSWEPVVYEGDAKRGGVVVAREFHLVDEDGKDRWVLALSRGGEPSVTFVNRAGWAPMAMGINQDGLPYFNMVLEPSRKGGPALVLMDSQMRARALLGLAGDGEPFLAMIDKEGRRRLVMQGGESKRGSLILLDGEGKPLHSWP